MKQYAALMGMAATGPKTITFGGGVDGIGVTSGTPKVYLVIYGNQWGTAGTDANGNMTLSNDPVGSVPYLQRLFKGLGTGGELWSGTMTQYCDGSMVSTGATFCPAGAHLVGYPTGGSLSGIWYDKIASPSQATAAQLAQEAVKAAQHFGNTTAASNRYAQYVILSATGTHPDGFNTTAPGADFCAWHDWNGNNNVPSSAGDIAFSNMPYVYDAGSGCGAGSVNGATAQGNLDGVSITEGHEYAETLTDQIPSGGWNNPKNSAAGTEVGDECADIASGQGATQNVVLGKGSFAMQSIWSNDTNQCEISHPIVGGSGSGGMPTANFSYSARGLVLTLTDSSTDSGGTISAHAWTFGDGATSTASNPSHTYAAAGTYRVTEKVTDRVSGKTSAKTSPVTVTAPQQLIGNSGFESGTSSPWTLSPGTLCSNSSCSGEVARGGTYFVWMDGYGSAHTDSTSQTVTIPGGSTSASLSYYLHIDTAETDSTAYDTLTVQVLNSSGTVLKTLATYSNVNAASGYTVHTANLAAYIGQTVTIKFTGTEDSSNQTTFLLDDVTLMVQ